MAAVKRFTLEIKGGVRLWWTEGLTPEASTLPYYIIGQTVREQVSGSNSPFSASGFIPLYFDHAQHRFVLKRVA